MSTAEYWVRQVRGEVRFAEGVRAAEAEGASRYLECGPQGVLSAMAASSVDAAKGAIFAASQRKGVGEVEALMEAVGRMHGAGVELNWEAILGGMGAPEGRAADLRVPAARGTGWRSPRTWQRMPKAWG